MRSFTIHSPRALLWTITLSAIMVAITATPTGRAVPSILSCRDEICNDTHTLFNCRDRGFVCCRGEANDSYQVLTQRHGLACCVGAGEQYNVVSQICVNGRVRTKDRNEDNCGPDNVFNNLNQVCCGNNVFAKIEGGQCCGNEYLVDNTKACCNGRIYNTYEQVCCPLRRKDPVHGTFMLHDIPYGRCCLDKAFNPKTHSCEESKRGMMRVMDRASRDMENCAGVRYDPRTHGCCRGESTGVFERRTALCHIGHLYMKTDAQQNAICIYSIEDHTGQHAIHAIPYTKNSKTVCSRNIGVVSLGPFEAICGENIYNTSTDLCCSGKLHRNTKLRGFKCCQGTNIFDPQNEICCVNEVSPKTARNIEERCCFKKPYVPETHDCVGNEVIEKACPSYGNRCNVSIETLTAMKKVYIYFGIAGEISATRQSRKKKSREWTLTDMKMLKFKRGKVTVVKSKVKGKQRHILKSTECGCPENLIAGARYMFVSSTPMKRRTLSLDNVNKGFVVPTEDKEQIGQVFATVIEKSR